MRLGIDIDDVITNTSDAIKEYIEKYDTTGEIGKYLVEIMRGEIPNSATRKFLDEHLQEIYLKATIKPNAKEVLNRLIDSGNEIYYVTSRGEERYKGSYDATLEFFEKNGIKSTGFKFDAVKKAEVCKENGIQVLVDDSVKYCEEAEKAGVKGIIFNSGVNKDIKTKLDRVDNWLELEEKIKMLKEIGD